MAVRIRKAPKKFAPIFNYEVVSDGKRIGLSGTKREAESNANKVRRFQKSLRKNKNRKSFSDPFK